MLDVSCPYMPCSSRIISEMLPDFLTVKKCDFHKPIIHSQIHFSQTCLKGSPKGRTKTGCLSQVTP